VRVPQVTVRRIVANVAAKSVAEVGKFYADHARREADPERSQFVLTETGIGHRLRAAD
jgi:hypothetical protein